MTIWTAAITLFLVMDPLGNIPVFLSVLNYVDEDRRRKIIIRELLIALVIMLCFFFFGTPMMRALSISEPSLSIAGGIILFIIAIRMIFPLRHQGLMGEDPELEPFIVPLAIPLVAGPSTIATILLMVSKQSNQKWEIMVAMLGAWLVSSVLLYFSEGLRKIIRKRGLAAIERLMGMILTTISVEMLLSGIASFMDKMD